MTALEQLLRTVEGLDEDGPDYREKRAAKRLAAKVRREQEAAK